MLLTSRAGRLRTRWIFDCCFYDPVALQEQCQCGNQILSCKTNGQ